MVFVSFVSFARLFCHLTGDTAILIYSGVFFCAGFPDTQGDASASNQPPIVHRFKNHTRSGREVKKSDRMETEKRTNRRGDLTGVI